MSLGASATLTGADHGDPLDHVGDLYGEVVTAVIQPYHDVSDRTSPSQRCEELPFAGCRAWTTILEEPRASWSERDDANRHVLLTPAADVLLTVGQHDVWSGVSEDLALGVAATDAATGDVLWHVVDDRDTGPDHLEGAVMSADGTRLYVASAFVAEHVPYPYGHAYRYAVQVLALDVATGAEAWRTELNLTGEGVYTGDHASGLALSGDGTRLVAGVYSSNGGFEASLAVLDTATGDAVAVHAYPQWEFLRVVAATPDGRVVALARPADASLHAVGLDPATGAVAWTTDLGIDDSDIWESGGAASPDGATVAIAAWSWRGGARTVTVLDAASGTPQWTRLVPRLIDDVAWSPDGTRLALPGGDDLGAVLDVLDAATGATTWQRRTITPERMVEDDRWYAAAWGPGGGEVAVTGVEGTVFYVRYSDLVVRGFTAADGTPTWRGEVDGTYLQDLGYAVTYAPDASRVYAAGTIELGGSSQDKHWTVVAIDPDGEPMV